MGGGKSSTPSTLPPPPKPTPDVDIATSAAEAALQGRQVASYESSVEEEADKATKSALGKTETAPTGPRPRRRERAPGSTANNNMAASAVLTG